MTSEFRKTRFYDDPGFDASPMHRIGRTAGFCLALFGLSAPAVSAGICLEQARALAYEHGLAIDPPNAPRGDGDGDGVTAQELKRSGGVIEPPPVNDPAVIEPPGGVRYGMPTVPQLEKSKKAPPEGTAGPLSPEKTALLESILVAARAEALRNNEKDCFVQLKKAQDLVGGDNKNGTVPRSTPRR